jgi:hypothetical protein
VTSPALPDPRLRADVEGPYAVGRVAGHRLLARGEAWLAVDCYSGRCATNLRGTVHQDSHAGTSVRGVGHAVCECGVLSGHLRTGAARRRWWRQHKGRVLMDQPEPAGQPAPVDPAQVA